MPFPGENVTITVTLDVDAAALLHQKLNEVRGATCDQLVKATHEIEVGPLTTVVGALAALSAAIFEELQHPEVAREIARRRRNRQRPWEVRRT